MSRLRRVPRDVVLVVLLVIVPVACLARVLQLEGHGWGDDFALYIRQADSLIDGNIGEVIADNHANQDLAARPGFTPLVYPWTFPLLLAPFTRWWGWDLDRLELVEIACWCGFLACWYALLRRRMPTWLALLTTAAAGYSLVYVQHTGAILSELPYMFGLALVLWLADRFRRTAPAWDAIERGRLVALGLAAMLVFNIRREGVALVPALLAMQLADVAPRARSRAPVDWRAVATPHVAFVTGVVGFQLLLPSALAPEYEGSGLGHTWRKLRGPFQDSFVQQLGFDRLDGVAVAAVALLVLVGVAVRLRRHAVDDLGILVAAVGSVVIAGMIPADSSRYTMAATPLLAYFAIQGLAAIPRSRHALGGVAACALLAASAVDLPGAVDHARTFAREGRTLAGPEQATSQEMFAAVRRHTHRDDLVAFFKARAMTLYTDRRGVQSRELPIILERADWFVMGRAPGSVGIPFVNARRAAEAGLQEVWSNEHWILWRVPDPRGAMLNG